MARGLGQSLTIDAEKSVSLRTLSAWGIDESAEMKSETLCE
jgi:hypothetical protein